MFEILFTAILGTLICVCMWKLRGEIIQFADKGVGDGVGFVQVFFFNYSVIIGLQTSFKKSKDIDTNKMFIYSEV